MEGWANGRDVTKTWEQAKSNRDARVYESEETDRILLSQDVSEAISSMLPARQPKSGKQNSQRHDTVPYEFAMESQDRSAPKQKANTATSQQSRTNVDESECSLGALEADVDDDRDSGVPDEIWNELLVAKERERERLDELQRQQEAYEKYLIQIAELEREAQQRYEMELERIRKELEREEQERARRQAEEAERKRKNEEVLERNRIEKERQRREDEIRQKMEMQKRLQQIRPCPAGFRWIKMGSGWYCAGGSHFVSDNELKCRFGYNA